MSEKIIRNVPANKVGEVVQTFIDHDETTNIVCAQQPDGTWTVTASI